LTEPSGVPIVSTLVVKLSPILVSVNGPNDSPDPEIKSPLDPEKPFTVVLAGSPSMVTLAIAGVEMTAVAATAAARRYRFMNFPLGFDGT
jgi:hypothetical protein